MALAAAIHRPLADKAGAMTQSDKSDILRELALGRGRLVSAVTLTVDLSTTNPRDRALAKEAAQGLAEALALVETAIGQVRTIGRVMT